MCLYNKPELVKNFLHKRQKTFTFYKVLKYNSSHGCLESIYRNYLYSEGEHIVIINYKIPCLKYKNIGYGFHLFKTKPKILNCHRSQVIVKFICDKKDLIGIGEKDICFRKIYLDKKEYLRAKKLLKAKLRRHDLL